MDTDLIFRQRHQLSQAQIQALELLSMDSMELNQFLKDEYLENPLLDYEERAYAHGIDSPGGSLRGPAPARDPDPYHSEKRESLEAVDPALQKEDLLPDYLLSQLDSRLYSKQEWELFYYLTGCLDDNGFFTVPIKEVAQKKHVSESLVARSLEILKTLEPYGIFSSGLQECLIRQLDASDLNTETLTRMIQCHLQDIADGKIGAISRSMHLSTIEVRKNIAVISRLNPRPLSGFSSGSTCYIIPDIIFRKERENWEIILNDSWVENYHINDYYLQMMRSSSDENLISYFKDKLDRINFIFQNIEHRRKTIHDICSIILDIQNGYLDGKAPLIPMTMSDVARRAGIHPSTVSRAVRGKYLQYPNGTVFIRKLFTSPAAADGPESVTPMAVKQSVKELIESEDRTHPYSDQELSRLLSRRNIKISRRTVAKYREELGIKGSFDRRVF